MTGPVATPSEHPSTIRRYTAAGTFLAVAAYAAPALTTFLTYIPPFDGLFITLLATGTLIIFATLSWLSLRKRSPRVKALGWLTAGAAAMIVSFALTSRSNHRDAERFAAGQRAIAALKPVVDEQLRLAEQIAATSFESRLTIDTLVTPAGLADALAALKSFESMQIDQRIAALRAVDRSEAALNAVPRLEQREQIRAETARIQKKMLRHCMFRDPTQAAFASLRSTLEWVQLRAGRLHVEGGQLLFDGRAGTIEAQELRALIKVALADHRAAVEMNRDYIALISARGAASEGTSHSHE